MDKKTFDQYVKLAKDAFKALLVNTDAIDEIVKANESAYIERPEMKWLLPFFFFPWSNSYYLSHIHGYINHIS